MKFIAGFFILALMVIGAQGAIIDTINAMPGNTWLRLPENGSKPITRSSSNVMHYDGDSLGYLWGTCHAGHHNDLWAFNLAANRCDLSPSTLGTGDGIFLECARLDRWCERAGF